MQIIVRDKDGNRYAARDARGIVRQMHRMSFAQARTDQEFMQESAERAGMMTGESVRSDTAKNFIEDLLTVGLLVRDAENGKD